MNLTAEQIIDLLKLEPNDTCGFMVQTYRSPHDVTPESLPDSFKSSRALGSVLYFMVARDTRTVMHRIRSDQMYHHYLGDPLEVILLYPDGNYEIVVVGNDLTAGMRPQLLIPGSTFHMSRVRRPMVFGYALLGTTAWPDVEVRDVELGEMGQLTAKYPYLAADIRTFMGDISAYC